MTTTLDTNRTRILANGEKLLSLAVAGRPTGTHPSTVSRWATRGVRKGGAVVKLETVRVGGRVKTSAEAVARFFTDLSANDAAGEPVPPTPTERRRAAEAANRELELAGA